MNQFETINMDLTRAVCIRSDQEQWLNSPAKGISRIPLEREAAESGHTSSFVKYAPGSSFAAHSHPNGEEIYVLDGIFSDENGDYPAGSYIRNPPGSHHSPFTGEGCTLFVKLNQFQAKDTRSVVLRPEDRRWQPGIGKLEVSSLHTFESESTALVYWPENEVFQAHAHYGGEEIVVLSGRFIDEHGEYPAHSWLRSPHMSKHLPYVKEATLILVKVGHLKG
jgi:anti-sigma factor ChrR (cupin superfamily)